MGGSTDRLCRTIAVLRICQHAQASVPDRSQGTTGGCHCAQPAEETLKLLRAQAETRRTQEATLISRFSDNTRRQLIHETPR